MGALIWLPGPNSSSRSAPVNPGSSLPSPTPTSVQIATHRLR